ncbi:acyltransferase family protein [Paenibacillus polymyxa]|uniref:acyltransferase family protein n=1 Tax=Paenibacillus polymyxa TaxID=1406 RepID=UPI000471921F|nr:acyltransferase [Paenibacillus polymyxa]
MSQKSVLLEKRMIGKENNFDFMRLAAAVMVLLSHSYPISGNANEFFVKITNGQWPLGGLSVAIFFVISGFLISMSFNKTQSKFRFVFNRLLRVFPGLICAVLFSTFVIGAIVTNNTLNDYLTNPQTYDYLKSSFLFPVYYELPGVFTGNIYPNSVNGSLWTLPYEVLFYALVLIIGSIGWFSHKTRESILLLFVLVLYLNIFSPHIFDNYNFYGISMGSLNYLLGYFLAGTVIYCYRDQIIISRKLMLCSFIVILISFEFGGLKEVFMIFGSYLIICFAYSQKIKIYKINKYGDFTYGMYIYAFPVQQFVTWIFGGGKMNTFFHFSISFIICLACSYLSWHLVEKKFLSLKSLHKNKREPEHEQFEVVSS